MSNDFGPDLDRFPDEMPLIPQMAMQLKSMDYAPVESVASNIGPLRDQLMLNPGDWAIPLMMRSTMDDDLAICQLVDLSEHMLEYPDWETRVKKDWVLVRWASYQDHEREPDLSWHLGWFERGRLIPCPEENRVEEIKQAIIASGSDYNGSIEPPEWTTVLFAKQLSKIREKRPDAVRDPATCGKCQSEEVQLHGSRTTKMSAPAGYVERDGKRVIANAAHPQFHQEIEAHLHCRDCGARQDLDPDDYIVEQ